MYAMHIFIEQYQVHVFIIGCYMSILAIYDDIVVRLSVHVHFNMGLSPQDSCVPGQRPSVCSIGLMVSV